MRKKNRQEMLVQVQVQDQIKSEQEQIKSEQIKSEQVQDQSTDQLKLTVFQTIHFCTNLFHTIYYCIP